MKNFPEIMRRTAAAGIQFLSVELELAYTFVQMAESASSPKKREMCRDDAAKALNAVRRFLPRIIPDRTGHLEWEVKVQELSRRLNLLQATLPNSGRGSSGQLGR